RTRMKVGLRLFARCLLHFSVDTNLPVEFDPVKPKRSVWVGVELFPLCALVIRKEHKTLLIETLQKNNSHRRSAIPTGGGKTHCVHVADTGLNCCGKPIGKLSDRIAIEIAPPQAFADVIIT